MKNYQIIPLFIFLVATACTRTHPQQSAIASDLSTGKIDVIGEVEAHIAKENIVSVEQFLEKLPPALKPMTSNFALVYASQSLQDATEGTPRIVLFKPEGGLYMAVAGRNSGPRGQNVEMISYNAQAQRFEFADLHFLGQGNAPKLVRNPAVCAGCHSHGRVKLNPGQLNTEATLPDEHQAYLKPNWESYPRWPGVFGSYSDFVQPEEEMARIRETELWETFRPNLASPELRYRFLDSSKFRGVDDVALPSVNQLQHLSKANQALNSAISCNLEHRAAGEVARHPGAKRILNALVVATHFDVRAQSVDQIEPRLALIADTLPAVAGAQYRTRFNELMRTVTEQANQTATRNLKQMQRALSLPDLAKIYVREHDFDAANLMARLEAVLASEGLSTAYWSSTRTPNTFASAGLFFNYIVDFPAFLLAMSKGDPIPHASCASDPADMMPSPETQPLQYQLRAVRDALEAEHTR